MGGQHSACLLKQANYQHLAKELDSIIATLKKNTLYNFELGGDKNAKRLILVKS
jgi:hypothetical protein